MYVHFQKLSKAHLTCFHGWIMGHLAQFVVIVLFVCSLECSGAVFGGDRVDSVLFAVLP